MKKQPTLAEEITDHHEEAVKALKFNLGVKKYVLDPLLISAAGLTVGTFAVSVYDLAAQQGLNLDNVVGAAGGVGAAFGLKVVSRVVNREARANSRELRLLEAVPTEEVPVPLANIEYLPRPDAEEPALAA